MSRTVGFVINPIAGMGGRVGLKGTDGVLGTALRLGAQPTSPGRAAAALGELSRHLAATSDGLRVRWLTCSGGMGEDALIDAGFTKEVCVVYRAPADPTADHTKAAVEHFLQRGVDLIVFCGGDGTARDICEVVDQHAPILGIPAGVKMYSGVFGTTPARTAEIMLGFLLDRLTTAQVDVLDVDETQYRQDRWNVRLYHAALTPYEPTYSQSAKALIEVEGDLEVKAAIAESMSDDIERQPNRLVLLGPGSTVKSVAEHLGAEKTLLGVDAFVHGCLVGADLNEQNILELLGKYDECQLILSPIGSQGFILGRGNLQLSPRIVRRIGADNITVIATPAKLARTPVLRFDTGDPELDRELAESGYIRVLTGYGRRRLMKVEV